MILEVFLPIPINKSFYYKFTGISKIKAPTLGTIVEVNFKNKMLIGLVWNVITKVNVKMKIKEINRRISGVSFSDETIKTIRFMSHYTCNPIPLLLKIFLSGFSIKYYQKNYNDSKKQAKEAFSKIWLKKKLLLTEEQTNAVNKIKRYDKGFNAILLDGVTSSGKTRVYMHAIKETLKKGFQCIILVPEKILTKQWIEEISNDFGLLPEIYHSSISQKKRNEVWLGVLKQKISLVIGTRSALFLPFKKIGLIVIDEEHDSSFKQEEGIIINVRDMGVVRAKNSNCQIILSSATPSIETVHNCLKKKYFRVSLKNRVKGSLLPNIKVVDLKSQKTKNNFWISTELEKEIKINIANKKQSLIFLNRRGYASAVICKSCGFTKFCKNCDVSLVLHKKKGINKSDYLLCHHCNYNEVFEDYCDHCKKSGKFLTMIPGIEKINEEVLKLFPQSRICLASSDILKKEKDWEKTLNLIKNNKFDIIIGTQITAKGHHFPSLKSVGILNIDNLLNSFDLRSSEKAFQLITQVSGRAGREYEQGNVIIQTLQPNHPVIKAISNSKKEEFLKWEINQRKTSNQPPFSILIAIIVTGPNNKHVEKESLVLANMIKKRFSNITIYGPAPALLNKLRRNFRWRILLKINKIDSSLDQLKTFLLKIVSPKDVNLKIDVDPLTFF